MYINFDSSQVAKKEWYPPSGHSNRPTILSAPDNRPIDSGSWQSSSFQSNRDVTGSLESKQADLLARGLLREAVGTGLSFTSLSTRKKYIGGWRDFITWCQGQDTDPSIASIQTIKNYLQFILDNTKLSSRTIKSRISAIPSKHSIYN